MAPPNHSEQEKRYGKSHAIDEEQQRPRPDGRRAACIEQDRRKHRSCAWRPAERKAAAKEECPADAVKAAPLKRAVLAQKERDAEPPRHEKSHEDDEQRRALPQDLLIGEKPCTEQRCRRSEQDKDDGKPCQKRRCIDVKTLCLPPVLLTVLR